MEEKKSVAIVDDEEFIGHMVSKFLQNEGLNTTYFDRMLTAREDFLNKIYDYYFLDLNLPDGTGFDLVPIIQEKAKNAKIIIISAHDGHEELSRAKAFGVHDFIHKPFNKQSILNTVKK
ncbi:response regulator [uncultured Roseivirga sp.]|uniref:response regulator n=1 Tax=uncultured Roseivirga sp. TaxID=543088 RepID=UPI0030D7664B|tara:strand:- start:237608 stop:237964 length:357 start_codon:yes stop_codon:yes gene_type:complete